MKFHEAIVYAEKGYKIKVVGDLVFETFDQVKAKDLTKDQLFVDEWELELPATYETPCFVKMKSGIYCELTANGDLQENPNPYIARDLNRDHKFYASDVDIDRKVTITEVG